MSKLRQIVFAHSFHDLGLSLQALAPDRLDALAAGGGEAGSDGAPISGVRDALDEAVLLQVVDQAGDVARGGIHVVRKVAQRHITASVEPKQNAEPALAEPVLLGPPLLQQVHRATGKADCGQRLNGAQLDFERVEHRPKVGVEQAAFLVLFQLPADPRDRVLQIRVFHIERLHYYHIQDFGRGYSPKVIVDAHLDIAWGAVSRGHGFLVPPPPGFLISRPSLVAAGVGLIFATLYCAPARAGRAMRTRFVYESAHEANLMATAQVNYYRSCGLELITDGRSLAAYARGWKKGRLAAVLLMEGADPIETPSQLGAWTDRGVRIIGPAWGGTRYAGGTGAPGGLTELGRQLLKAMRRKKVILDLSHLADQAVGDAFAMWRGPIMASHANSRAIVAGDRQLTDETVAEIARRGGIVGISFYQAHLRSRGRATLDDVVKHMVHHAWAAGGPEAVGIGTDLDGGFDSRQAPMDSLAKLNELPARLRLHFNRSQVEGIMGANWLAFLERSLPD